MKGGCGPGPGSDGALLPREFVGGRLRRLRASDHAAFQACRSLPELGRYERWSPMNDAATSAFLDEMHRAPAVHAGAWVQIGIADAATDALIGDIGMHLVDDGLAGEFGFTLQPSAAVHEAQVCFPVHAAPPLHHLLIGPLAACIPGSGRTPKSASHGACSRPRCSANSTR